MNLEMLKIFIEVSSLGSFAATARKLNIDPSSISRSIAVLEEELKIRLFQRTTRQLVLTEVGEMYLRRIVPLINEFNDATEEVHRTHKEPSGTLRMTTSIAFGQICLLPFIAEFRERYPDIKLELQLTDSVVDLIADGLDVALRLSPTFNSNLIGIRLFDTKYRICASPSYLESNPPIFNPKDLENHHCVVFTRPEYLHWTFKDKNLNLMTISVKSNVSISSALALKEAVSAGLGLALLADWLVHQDILDGKLMPLLESYQVTAQNFDTSVWLLHPSRHFIPQKTRLMIEFLKEKYRKIP
jgi:DNA-binding transcriptional LysR family regulator